jgi:hypothetical protein
MFILGDEGGSGTCYEAVASSLFERIESACSGQAEWPLKVRASLRGILDLFATDPQAARLLLVDVHQVGPGVRRQHEQTLARLADLLRAGRDLPDAPPMPDVVEDGLIGSASFVLARALRTGESLPALLPDLAALVLVPYLGREGAERIAGRDD